MKYCNQTTTLIIGNNVPNCDLYLSITLQVHQKQMYCPQEWKCKSEKNVNHWSSASSASISTIVDNRRSPNSLRDLLYYGCIQAIDPFTAWRIIIILNWTEQIQFIIFDRFQYSLNTVLTKLIDTTDHISITIPVT